MTISQAFNLSKARFRTPTKPYISPVKKASALLLLSLFLFQLGGWLLPFYAHQQSIRHTIKQRIKKGVPEGELVYFEASENFLDAIEWENDHEFRYQGSMYDVVEVHTADGKVRYACINDIQEEQLFEQLDLLVQKELEKEAKGLTLKKNTRLHYLQASLESYITLEEIASNSYSLVRRVAYQSPILDQTSPPPELL